MANKHLLLFSLLASSSVSLVSMEKNETENVMNSFFGLPRETQANVTTHLTRYAIVGKEITGEKAKTSGSFRYETEGLGMSDVWQHGLSSASGGKHKRKIVYVDPATQCSHILSCDYAYSYSPFGYNPGGEQYRCMGPFTIGGTKVVMINKKLTLFPIPRSSWFTFASGSENQPIAIDRAQAELEKNLGKDERCTSVDACNGTLYTVKPDGSVDSLSYQNDGSFVRASIKPPLSQALIQRVEQSFLDAIKPKISDFTFKHIYDFNIKNPNILLDIYSYAGGLCAAIDRKGSRYMMCGELSSNSRSLDKYPSIWSGASVETSTVIGTQIAALREISISLAPVTQFLTVAAAHHFCSLKEDARSVEFAKDIIDAVKEMPFGSERYHLVWCSEKDGKYALKDVYTWLKRKFVKRSTRLYD